MVASPCRRHPCSWHHANLVESYRAAAEAQQQQAEAASGGYTTELADYWETHRRLTFREWLMNYREDHQ